MLRILSFPLRLVRDLPIGLKLLMTSAGALCLMSGVAWFALDRLTVVGALQDGVAEQAGYERAVQRSLLAAQELRVVSRELQILQTVPSVKAAAERAAQQRAAAQQILQQMQAAAASPAARAALDQAQQRLAAMADAVSQEAALRTDMLTARQKRLFQALPMFESSLKRLTDEIARDGAALSGVDSVRDTTAATAGDRSHPAMVALDAYRIAITQLQAAALMFMATGNPGSETEVRAAAAEAGKDIAVILAGDAAEAVKADARMTDSLGSGIAQAAVDLIAQSSHLDEVARKDVEAASQAMQAAIGQVAESLAAAVRTASDNAAAARSAAQGDMILLIGGLAVTMISLGLLTTWLIAGPIRSLTRSVQAIARGETATPVAYCDWRDETGRMAAAVETLRGVMRQTFLQSQMIEQLPIGVMTAGPDTDVRITYLNAATAQLLATVKDHLRVAPDRLAGQGLGLLHPDLAREAAAIADVTRLPHRARVVLGPETLALSVTAIHDQHGGYAGPMLIWHRLTDRVRLVDQFERSVGTIAATFGHQASEVQQAAQAMTGAAADSGHRIAAATEASAAASGHVSAAAGGAEELAASVAEIGRQVAESTQIAGQAVREAEATDRCVSGLSEAAGRIGDVVRLISDIAGRTNLLALNATIEAARAGEAGKGFAVVASEVKTLATQTARATQDIGAQIAAMQQATGQAVTALRSIGGTIQRMNEIATAIAAAVEEQGAATQEIARSVQQAAAGAAEVDGNMAAVSRAVDDTGERSQSVLAAATALTEQSAVLKAEVQGFLTAVQQAA